MARSREYQQAFKEGRTTIAEEEEEDISFLARGQGIGLLKLEKIFKGEKLPIKQQYQEDQHQEDHCHHLISTTGTTPHSYAFWQGTTSNNVMAVKISSARVCKLHLNDLIVKLQVIRDRLVDNKWSARLEEIMGILSSQHQLPET